METENNKTGCFECFNIHNMQTTQGCGNTEPEYTTKCTVCHRGEAFPF